MFIKKDTLRGLESFLSIEEIRNFKKPKSDYQLNKIYEAIKISKLGWINIDKFAPEETKIKISLKSNTKLDAIQTYIIDSENNTILNVYNQEIDIPINRSFYIISFGLKNDIFYGFKKSIRFSKDEEYTIAYKKLKASTQLKSFFTLD